MQKLFQIGTLTPFARLCTGQTLHMFDMLHMFTSAFEYLCFTMFYQTSSKRSSLSDLRPVPPRDAFLPHAELNEFKAARADHLKTCFVTALSHFLSQFPIVPPESTCISLFSLSAWRWLPSQDLMHHEISWANMIKINYDILRWIFGVLGCEFFGPINLRDFWWCLLMCLPFQCWLWSQIRHIKNGKQKW